MAIGVPLSIITPFVGVEFDPSRAQRGPAEMPFNVVIIGQMLSTGTGTAETLYQVFNEGEVQNLAGPGSMLHSMCRRFWANNTVADVYIMPLADAVGTQATRVLTITGTATEAGELVFRINGTRIAVSVAVGDTADTVGDAVETAVNDLDWLTWTAANVSGVVTMTQRHDGVAAGDNDMRLGDNPGEQIPAGLTAVFGATTPGTVDPDVQDAIDAIGDLWAALIINPYADDSNMGKLEDWLDVNAGPLYQRDGLCYQSYRGTVSEVGTFASNGNRNSQYMALFDAGNAQISTYELTAAVCGQIAESVISDPAVPLHRMSVRGVTPRSLSQRRTLIEANNLAKNGASTLTDDLGVQTQNMVTMYLKNSAGAADTSYRYQNTVFILQRLRYRFVQRILGRYPRAKLLASADRIEAGQQYITPELGRAEALDWFQQEEAQGQVQDFDSFKDQVICRISSTNPNRLEWILPPELVKQFIVGSGIMQFY